MAYHLPTIYSKGFYIPLGSHHRMDQEEQRLEKREIVSELLEHIIIDGCTCLNSASLYLGRGCKTLSLARDYLLEENLIEEVPGQKGRLPQFISYQIKL